jgi:hypothetical protein
MGFFFFQREREREREREEEPLSNLDWGEYRYRLIQCKCIQLDDHETSSKHRRTKLLA